MGKFEVTVGAKSEVVEANDELDAIRVFRLSHPEGTAAPSVAVHEEPEVAAAVVVPEPVVEPPVGGNSQATLDLPDSEISEIAKSIDPVAVEPTPVVELTPDVEITKSVQPDTLTPDVEPTVVEPEATQPE